MRSQFGHVIMRSFLVGVESLDPFPLCAVSARGIVVLEGVNVLLCWAAESRSLRFSLRLFSPPA